MSKLSPLPAEKINLLRSAFSFPKEWEVEIAHFAFNEVRDGTHDSPKDSKTGVPLVTSKNLINGVINFSNTKTISFDDHAEISKRSAVSSGDLLFSMIGTIGNVAVVPETTNFSVKNVGLFRKNDHLLNVTFAFNWLRSQSYQKYLEALQRGGNQKFVSLGVLRESPIPIPPLAEQKVIADKLDELLAQVDTLKARLDAIPAILKRFRQSVLAAAVSGKLTEEWREGKSLSEIQFTHNDKLDPVTETDLYENSIPTWKWVRLGSIANLINGDRGKNYPNQSEYVENGIPFINTGHIDPDGTLSIQRMNYITQEKYETLGGGKTNPSDLVYCLRGATMGKTARVNLEIGAIASSLVIVRPTEILNRDFAYYFLISPQAKGLIRIFDNGSAQPNLSAKSLASYAIQLPPIEEQTEIVRRVEQLFTYADQVEQQVKNAQARVNQLTQSILAKAFRGELTEQWRKDNPELISGDNSAAALLGRIKAERAAATTTKKKAPARKAKA